MGAMIPQLSRRTGFRRETAGASAVEFALVSPLLLLIAAFTLDFGAMLFTRFQLNQAVTASATYGLINGAQVTPAEGGDLAERLAAIAANGDTATTARVVVNNGPVAESNGGIIAGSGTPGPAQSCYCPDLSEGAVDWGTAVGCDTTCASGAPAGRYIEINARRPYQPLFAGYGILEAGEIVVAAVVRAQ